MLNNFTVSHRAYAIGLDEQPRFSWKLTGGQNDTKQVAYQLQMIKDGRMIWNTGKVESDQSVLVPYEGQALEPCSRYHVQATVWDNHGVQSEGITDFETGLMEESSWRGAWITAAQAEDDKRLPVFTKTFETKKAVRAARLYATACGIYEAAVNGQKVGDAFFAPGWTSYHHQLQYQTYDITELLNQQTREGKSAAELSTTKDETEATHEIAITVGNGWYKGYLGFAETPDHYGKQKAVRAQIRLEYEDGTVEIIGTDESWQVQAGVVQSAEFYYGETRDLTKVNHKEGRTATGESFGAAQLAGDEVTKTIGIIIAQEDEPVRVTKRFAAVKKFLTPKGELVLDFGQNMAGVVEVKLPKLPCAAKKAEEAAASKGEKAGAYDKTGAASAPYRLVVRHAETLDRDGNFYTENLRTAVSIDTYVYGEDTVGTVQIPQFTFHGFRYIAVEGFGNDEAALEALDTADFTACALHTDMKQTGTFTCDNALVNQLQSNITWGQRSNFVDVPTDCPQRNERLGWTGDAQVFCSTAGYNFDTSLFFKKWLRDVAAETTPEWGVPHVVPNILGDQDGAAAWSDCATIIPWEMYQMTGDVQFLIDQFDSMQMWVDYIHGKCRDNGLWQDGFQYGDWLALDAPEALAGGDNRCGGTDRHLVANAYYAYSTKIVRDAAKVLLESGVRADEMAAKYDLYAKRYQQIVDAIGDEYVTKTGRLVSETQTACVVMLYFDLVRPEFKERVLEALVGNLAAHKNHLTTGFVGTPYLCHCLSEYGQHALAADVFLKEDFPGWLYAVKKGATTIWERWNSIAEDGTFDASGMNSLNHYAYGSIGSWMYKKIAGINAAATGYKKIEIRPMLTVGMTSVRATLDCPYGEIVSAWTCKDGKITVDVTIPANTTATIILPEKEDVIEVGSGQYHYEYETTTHLEKLRFSFDSTLGEIVKEPLAVQLFNQAMPGMLDNPMIQYAYGMTMHELTAQAPQAKPLYEMVIDALNKAGV